MTDPVAAVRRQRLKALLERSRMPTGPMGFPEDWTSRPLWQEARP